MRKMIYVCPVDWRWIKQRPQFLAEELSAYDQVYVLYPLSKDRRGLQKKSKARVSLTPYVTLPTLHGRLGWMDGVNKRLVQLLLCLKIRTVQPDVIWLTLPAQIDYIPKGYGGRVVYDCMDDYIAFNRGGRNLPAIERWERALVERANLVFASSESLKGKLCARYQAPEEKIALLRNGYHASWPLAKAAKARTGGRLRIGYFGTISHWFDFALLAQSLERSDGIEYHLYGPVAGGVQIPAHERIAYHGVVEHDAIACCAAEMDALIMPFALNDIVLSVDPVKLYEYICLNRNILCIRYPEVERFAPYVLFYRTIGEYMAHIETLLTDNRPVYSPGMAKAFLEENSWSCRARAAHAAMEALFETEETR